MRGRLLPLLAARSGSPASFFSLLLRSPFFARPMRSTSIRSATAPRRLALSVLSTLALALLPRASAWAHQVEHRIESVAATVITLTYGDGAPFARQGWEARLAGAQGPVLSGTTDATGRAVILTSQPGDWEFRAWSDDGHGVDLDFVASTGSAPPQATANAGGPAAAGHGGAPIPPGLRIWFGLSCLLALFGVVQLWLRRRPAADPARPAPTSDASGR